MGQRTSGISSSKEAARGPAVLPAPRLPIGMIAIVGVAIFAGTAVAVAFIGAGMPTTVTLGGDAFATAHRILTSGSLYRMGFAIDVIALACLL